MFLLLCAVLLPILGGTALFILRPQRSRRIELVSVVLGIQAVCVAQLLRTAYGQVYSLGTFIDTLEIAFRIDGVGCFFAILFAGSGLLMVLFAFRYMSHEHAENRFFGFWLISAGVLTALSFADNLVTFYLFYELMTLSTVPLAMHEMTHKAIMAGLKYLFYSVCGALLALLGMMYLYPYAPTLAFQPGGFMSTIRANPAYLQGIAFLMIIGFCCKAGMFPLHGWLPTAHPVAPAPASALLSGCITKCGVLGVIRAVYFVAGADFLRGSWVQYTWLSLALITVFLGSMMAYLEPVMKKRLAYSTVSQLSYVLFGLSLFNSDGFTGALLQVVFHMIVKLGLFLCAGAIIFETGRTRVADLRGLGSQMPVTFLCWAGLALSLVGIPPFSGFISKWALAEGALAADIGIFRVLGPAVLLASALLTAGYLFPLPVRGFFPLVSESATETKSAQAPSNPSAQTPVELTQAESRQEAQTKPIQEAAWSMLLPIVVLTVLSLVLGIVTTPLSGIVASITADLL